MVVFAAVSKYSAMQLSDGRRDEIRQQWHVTVSRNKNQGVCFKTIPGDGCFIKTPPGNILLS